MNRNTESHFAQLPEVQIERSIFDLSHPHKTSFNVGDLIPFYWEEVLPGDTFAVTTSFVARLQTLLTPIMDNMYLDTYYFFVPNRLLWTHWREFMGENTDSAWLPAVEYTMPKISSPQNGWSVGTIADYLGVPPGVVFSEASGLRPNVLPFRAYGLICQEWFRDQNLSDPLNIPVGDSNQTGSNGTNYITDVVNGGMPFKAAKFHDYFTSCLPSPQKGPSVSFGVDPEVSVASNIPVFTRSSTIPSSYLGTGLKMGRADGVAWTTTEKLPLVVNVTGGPYGTVRNSSSVSSIGNIDLAPVNLYADVDAAGLSVSGVSFSINELRLAFQLQKFYEKNARGGSRYRELLKQHFGVSSPDARMMIPEYLGGHRQPIAIHEVTNQSQGEADFLGDLGAMSITSDIHEDFIKSFTEHGIVMGVCVVRYDHTYPQGLNRAFTRNSALDYYWPVFANIGEQPVYKYEIDATVRNGENRTAIFGYQEAWASYRYHPARCSSEMRPNVANTLASWHLADNYSAMPSLSDAWVREDKANVDRVLAVTSSLSNQIFADFYIKNTATRAMPVYSVPGLIDHH